MENNFLKTLIQLFSKPKEYFRNKYAFKYSIIWSTLFYSILMLYYFAKVGFFYGNAYPGRLILLIILPLGIMLTSVGVLYLCLKIFRLKPDFKVFISFVLPLTSLGALIRVVPLIGNYLGFAISIYLIVILFNYTKIGNEKYILKTILSFIVYVGILILLLIYVFSPFMIELEYGLERAKRTAEYYQEHDFMREIDEDSSLEDMERVLEFCKNEYTERTIVDDPLLCYAKVYPYYYEHNPDWVLEICLDPNAIADSIKTRDNRNRKKCLKFVAEKVLESDGLQTSLNIGAKSPDDSEACELQLEITTLAHEKGILPDADYIDYIMNFDNIYCRYDAEEIENSEEFRLLKQNSE